MGRAGGQKRRAHPPGGRLRAGVLRLGAAAPEQGGKVRGEGLAQHGVVVAAGGPDVLVETARPRRPQRGRGGQPLRAREEQAHPAREGFGSVTTPRGNGRALDRGSSHQHGVERGRVRGITPLPALPHSLRDVAAELAGRQRPDRARVPCDPGQLLAQPPPELRRQTVPARIGAAEQRYKTHARSGVQQLSRQLERHGAAGAEPGDDVRAVRLERSDLLREVRREILHARERLAPAVEPGRLEPEERLVVAQLLRQSAVAEHVAVVPGHREHGRAAAPSLEWHDRALLPCKRLPRAQQRQDLALVVLQPIPQLGRQHAGRRGAAQALALGVEVDAAVMQVGEETLQRHSSISSRCRRSAIGVCRRVENITASMASASCATLGRSNRLRSGRSTPDAARSCEVSRAAMREWPPRSKKLSSTPKSVRSRTAEKTPITVSSAGVRGATRRARGAAARSGAGSALRASLPFAVRGRASRRTKWVGTMYSGQAPRTSARSWSIRSPGRSAGTSAAGRWATKYATRCLSPASSRATTTTSLTAGCRLMAASISPGSIRKPRILTWWSIPPNHSSRPPGSQRARSPLRYKRALGANGLGTKRSRVSSSRRT